MANALKKNIDNKIYEETTRFEHSKLNASHLILQEHFD